MKLFKMKHLLIIESAVIVALLVIIGVVLYNYNKSDVNLNSKNVMVADEHTAEAIANAIIAEHRSPMDNMVIKDMGDYWEIIDYDYVFAYMYIRKVDGCVVYQNIYGYDDVDESEFYWSVRDVKQFKKEYYSRLSRGN